MPSVFDLNASNPFRPVDWRHRLAADRVASGLAFPRRTWDAATLEIASYLRRAEGDAHSRRLAAEFPSFHLAYGIYRDADPGLRFALEARLLTRGEAADIADSLGTDAAVMRIVPGGLLRCRRPARQDRFHHAAGDRPPSRRGVPIPRRRLEAARLPRRRRGARASVPSRSPEWFRQRHERRAGRNACLPWRAECGGCVQHKSDLDPRLVIHWPEIVGLIRKERAPRCKPTTSGMSNSF